MTTTQQIDSASAVELADARPLGGGEYFYQEDTSFPTGFDTCSICFVCGQRANTNTAWATYEHIRAIVQGPAAATRIAAMFKNTTACFPAGPYTGGGVYVAISACQEHKRRLEILHRLTEDGIITTERVSRAEKGTISRQEFDGLVAQTAFALCGNKERDRSWQNWYDAWPLCLSELGRIPTPLERRERAERLWQERKQAQALEDWLQAEKQISALYTPDA